MKKAIEFCKMVAAGNDFVVLEDNAIIPARNLNSFAQRICDRKYGIGADGLLFIAKSEKADIRMRIFNADGSEAEMCGNGARCAAFWQSARRKAHSAKLKIETKAGIIESEVKGDKVKIKLTDPEKITPNIVLKVNSRKLKVNFVDTGVPHAVIFTEGLGEIDVNNIGRAVRYHKKFQPGGTNVDFVEIVNDNFIRVRTYERGVEAETLACGTGSTASAIITGCRLQVTGNRLIKVETQGGEILKVFFNKNNAKVSDVWLEGEAGLLYDGRFYV